MSIVVDIWSELVSDTPLCLQHIRAELDSFEVLYSRFLGEGDTSINWGKIQLLPFGAVSVSTSIQHHKRIYLLCI